LGKLGPEKPIPWRGEIMQKVLNIKLLQKLHATSEQFASSAFLGGCVMPRAVRYIFNILETQKDDDSMKATFLELYNEELTDMFASEDQSKFPEDRHRKTLVYL
jgi:hypothetical protein